MLILQYRQKQIPGKGKSINSLKIPVESMEASGNSSAVNAKLNQLFAITVRGGRRLILRNVK
jgi:hypothetical protein